MKKTLCIVFILFLTCFSPITSTYIVVDENFESLDDEYDFKATTVNTTQGISINLSWNKEIYDKVLIKRNTTEQVYEKQLNYSGGFDVVDANTTVAQIFTLHHAMGLTAVSAYINYSGSPDCKVEIRTTTGAPSVPSSTILAEQNFTPTHNGWIQINFTNTIFLTAGEYAIVWRNSNEDPLYVYYSANNTYSDGHRVMSIAGSDFYGGDVEISNADYITGCDKDCDDLFPPMYEYFTIPEGCSFYLEDIQLLLKTVCCGPDDCNCPTGPLNEQTNCGCNSTEPMAMYTPKVQLDGIHIATWRDPYWGWHNIHFSTPVYMENGTTHYIQVAWGDTCSPRCAYCPCVCWGINSKGHLYKLFGEYDIGQGPDLAFKTHGYGPPKELTNGTLVYFGNGTSFLDYNVTNNTRYYYTLRGVDGGAIQKYERFELFNDKMGTAKGTTWLAEEFRIGSTGLDEDFYIYSVKLKLKKEQGTINDLIVGIQAVDNNHFPTGDDLIQTSINGDSLSFNWNWVEFIFPDPFKFKFDKDTNYAIVLRCPNSTTGPIDGVSWGLYFGSDKYSGIAANSYDSGSSWSEQSNRDFDFQIWGFNATFGNTSYAWNVTADTISPSFDVTVSPKYQDLGGAVNITCRVTDNFGIKGEPTLTIDGPGTYHDVDNISMNYNNKTDTYWFLDNYIFTGNYYFTIYVDDVSNNHGFYSDRFRIQGWIDIYDEYPEDGAKNIPISTILGLYVNCLDGDSQLLDIYYTSNVTGNWEIIGANLSVPGGERWYQMSSYGVVESPYGVTVKYQLSDFNNKIYHSNSCPGNNLGEITGVTVASDTWKGYIKPIFNGERYGNKTYLSPDVNISIYEDEKAPTQWAWDDVKNLDIWVDSQTAEDIYLIVTYNMRYGENLKIYWALNVTDGHIWKNETHYFTTVAKTPVISNIFPEDVSISEYLHPTLSADVEDPNGDLMNISFYYLNETSNWTQIGSTQTGYNGTYTQKYTAETNYSGEYIWKIVVNDGINEAEKQARFAIRDMQDSPINFTATPINSSAIHLEWELDEHSDRTMIKRRTDRFPSFEDPGFIYEGYGNHTIDDSITPGTGYYYRAFTYNETDETWSWNYSWAVALAPPAPPTNLQVKTIAYNQTEITWTPGVGANTTFIYRKKGSYPSSITDSQATLVYQGSNSSFIDTGLGGNITYYYRAWSWCEKYLKHDDNVSYYYSEYSVTNASAYNTTFVGPPTLIPSVINIDNNSATLKTYVMSDGGEISTCGLYYGPYPRTNDINVTIGTYVTNDTYTYDLTGLTMADTYFFQPWGFNTYGFTTGDVFIFSTKPYEPATLSAVSTESNEIFFTWMPGDGADTTYIRYKEGSYPVNVTDGYLGYNGSGNFGTVSGLKGNTSYYFRAWSYNATSNVFSNYYADSYDTTYVGIPTVSVIHPPDEIEDTSAILKGVLDYDNGDACLVGFRYGFNPGSYVYNVTVGVYTTGASFSKNVTNLFCGTTYYYQAWAKNSYHFNHSAEYHFNTKPCAPVNFVATHWGATRMNLTWDDTPGADKVLIVRKEGSYPANMSDGITRYFGNDIYYHDYEWYPLHEGTTYYYRAWSYNETFDFYSNSYSSSNDTTSYLPVLTDETPQDNSTNINRYPFYSIQGYGNGLLNVTIYNAHLLNRSHERLGDHGSGSGYVKLYKREFADPINKTGRVYTTIRTGILSKRGGWGWHTTWAYTKDRYGNYRWYFRYRIVRHFVITNVNGGGAKIQSWKPTIWLDDPMLISGIYVNANRGHRDIINQKEGYQGYRFYMKFDYHDYKLNEWRTSSYEKPEWGSGYLYTDEPVIVDAVRVYKIAEKINESAASSVVNWDNRVNYITCIPPTKIHQQNITNGQYVSFISNQNLLNTTYYWCGVINDSLDLGFSKVFKFTTEKIIINNETPANKKLLTDKDIDHDCSVTVNHTGGDLMNISFYYKNNSNWVLAKTYANVPNGTYNFTYENSYMYGHRYYWKVTAEDGLDSYTKTYYFDVRGAYAFAPEFTIEVINLTKIYLYDIYSNDFADSILLTYSTSGFPTDPDDGILLFNSSIIHEYNHTGLSPYTKYYYSMFSWNKTDDIYTGRTKSARTFRPEIISIQTSTINTTGIRIQNLSGNNFTNSIMIRYKEDTYPVNETDGFFVTNLTYTGNELQYDHYGLIYNKTYYYRVFAWNETLNYWGENQTIIGKTNGPPKAYNEYPPGGSYGIDVNTSISITVEDFDGGDMDVYFRTNETGNWITFANWTQVKSGSTVSTLSHPFHLQEQLHIWAVNVTDGTFWYNATFNYTSGSLPVVTNITWVANTTSIFLHWNKLYGSDQTLIRRSNITYPITTTDGELIYFGPNETINDTNLTPGELYYYTFWGYNNTSGEYSIENTTLLTLTKPLPPSNISALPQSHRIINISWDMGKGATKTQIIAKLDFYPQNSSDGTPIYNSSKTYYLHSSLKPDDYFVPYPAENGTNNIGVYPIDGDPFNYSCDNDTSTKWDPDSQQDGTFSYILKEPQRLVGVNMLFQDFYNDPGATWNANITKLEIQENGTTWYTEWTGKKYNTGTQPEWWNHTLSRIYENVTTIRYTAHTAFIQPNIYEVVIGRLGYRYKYMLTSVTTKGGLIQYSNPVFISARTDNTPYNSKPKLKNETPPDNITKAEPWASISIDVYDDQGQTVELNLQTNFSGTWQTIATEYGLNETVTFNLPRWGFRKDVWWRVIANDHADVDDSYFYAGTNLNETGVFYFHTRKEYADPYWQLIAPPNATNTDLIQFIDKSNNVTKLWWKANGITIKNMTWASIHHPPFNLSTYFVSNIWQFTLEVENETDAGYIFSKTYNLTIDRNLTFYKTNQTGINYICYHLANKTTAQQFINDFQIPSGWWIHKYNVTTQEWDSVWVDQIYNNFDINPWDVIVVVGGKQLTRRINITEKVNTEQIININQGISYVAWSGLPTTLLNLSIGLENGDWIHVYDTLHNKWNSRWIGYALVGDDIEIKPYDVLVLSAGGPRTIKIGIGV